LQDLRVVIIDFIVGNRREVLQILGVDKDTSGVLYFKERVYDALVDLLIKELYLSYEDVVDNLTLSDIDNLVYEGEGYET